MCSAIDKFLNAEIKKYLYCLKKYCFLKVQANSMNNHFSKIIIPKYKPKIIIPVSRHYRKNKSQPLKKDEEFSHF